VEENVQPPRGKFLWPKFDGIPAWKAGAGPAHFAGVIEGVLFALTKSQLALMILSNLKIVAFAEG
jgi:hypothetical protein